MSIETINYAQIMCENKTKRRNEFIPIWFLDDSLMLQTHCHTFRLNLYLYLIITYVIFLLYLNNWIEFTYLIYHLFTWNYFTWIISNF